MKVALVYDRVNKWGGAEQVLLALHDIFPKAPLYSSVYDPKKAPWAKIFPEVIPTFLQKMSYFRGKHELLGALTPLAFESLDLSGWDTVISVTSEAAKGIITPPGTRHICYCLTPTRYLWSQKLLYENNPEGSLKYIPFYKYISRPIIKYAKNWDMVASQRPDILVAISTNVQKRIKKYYKRNSIIINPPVDINYFKNINSKKRDYYLYVGRLEAYKRVDLAIRAFNELGSKLVIIGIGSEYEKLKSISGNNVKFLRFVSQKRLREYYRYAKALIFPQEEDFGIAAIEALASGTPVIAYKSGGALDYVVDGTNGVFFDKQDVNTLIKSVKRFDRMDFAKANISDGVSKYSEKLFKEKFSKLVYGLS